MFDTSVWQAIQAISGVLALVVSVIALSVAWFARRHDNSKALERSIRDGDAATLKAATQSADDVRSTVEDIDARLRGLGEQMADLKASRANALTHRDLSHLHERINTLAASVSALVEAKDTTQKQLARILEYLMDRPR